MGNVDDDEGASFKSLVSMSLMFKFISMACDIAPENTSGLPFLGSKLCFFTAKLFVTSSSFVIFSLILEDH